MKVNNKIFVPTESMQQLLHGSYEHLISGLDTALDRKKDLFGEGVGTVKVLGTFPGSAVVLTEGGKFFRVSYEPSPNGEVKITGKKDLHVPLVTSNLGEFLRAEASSVVDAFLEGAHDKVEAKLQGLLPFIDRMTATSDASVVEAVVISLKTERPWRRVFKEQGPKIRKFLWDDLSRFEETRLRPKFSQLYDGSVPADNLGEYKDLVLTSVKSLSEKVSTLAKTLEDARNSLIGAPASFKDMGEDAMVTTFSAFVEDLFDDTQALASDLGEAAAKMTGVPDLGRLYDSVVEKMNDFEMAACFAEKMTAQLRDLRN